MLKLLMCMQTLLNKIKLIFSKPKDYPIRKGAHTKFIFIHINKTGGTSISKAIGLDSKKHATAKEIIGEVGIKNFTNSFVFAVVRNPWSKVFSHYKYRVKRDKTKLRSNPIGFKAWVKCTYGPKKDMYYYNNPKMFAPQVDWLKDDTGSIVVPNIIKFENLATEFSAIAKTIGVSNTLEHLNATKKESYIAQYDEETISIIANWFKEDIELFGFEFGQ